MHAGEGRYNAPVMQMKTFVAAILPICLLAGCVDSPRAATYVGVMIDNHEIARPHQRGLEKAVFIQEHFVEGMITRFEAVFDSSDLPESVGPVRSVRPYFVTGGSPVVSAIAHVGGSPEALALIEEDGAPLSFNALRGHDRSFSYDNIAPAPHHRFLTTEGFAALLADIPPGSEREVPFVFDDDFDGLPENAATSISIDYRSPVHDVSYEYDRATRSYVRTNRGEVQASAPKNVLVLVTDVEVVGPLGRLRVATTGSGWATLFRDGYIVNGRWEKESDAASYAFTTMDGYAMTFASGQVWMIVVDDLDRIAWK